MFWATLCVDMPCLADFPHLTEYQHNPFLSVPSGTAVGFMAAVAHSRDTCATALAAMLFCTNLFCRCCLQIYRGLESDVCQIMPQNHRGAGCKGSQGSSGAAFVHQSTV